MKCNISWNSAFRNHVTGCSIWKIANVKGCSSGLVHVWPHVCKAKMLWRGGRFIQFSKNLFTFFSWLFTIFHKCKLPPLKHILALSNMHQFWATACYFCNFQKEHPVVFSFKIPCIYIDNFFILQYVIYSFGKL